MPPKKDTKKDAVARPDNSGIAKNDVDFKLEFSAKLAPESPSFAVMFEWFSSTSEKTERYDTGFIDTWGKSTTSTPRLMQNHRNYRLKGCSTRYEWMMYATYQV
jgi:hypothetical protein